MFKVDDKVIFIKTGGDLDGATGSVIGEYVFPYYIVLMDHPLPNGNKAMVISGYCLKNLEGCCD